MNLKWALVFHIVCLLCIQAHGYSCSAELDKCTASVHPLLRNISYMFPSSEDEVKRMCGSWSKLVDCVRKYVNNCFDPTRKHYFNAAVENSIGTVHAICSSNSIQKEYLLHSKCFRKISIDNCRDTYNQLVTFVSVPSSTDDQICCGYSKFRDCVNAPLGTECGAKARNLMHHSLAFLMQKCDAQTESGRSYEHSCNSYASVSAHRAPKADSAPEVTDNAMLSSAMDAENDYYLNEKHANEVSATGASTTETDHDHRPMEHGFRPVTPINLTRSRATHDQPTLPQTNEHAHVRKVIKPTMPVAAPTVAEPSIGTSDDYEPEAEVDAAVTPLVPHHHSTESPQFVRYDAESEFNNGGPGPTHTCFVYAHALIGMLTCVHLFMSRPVL